MGGLLFLQLGLAAELFLILGFTQSWLLFGHQVYELEQYSLFLGVQRFPIELSAQVEILSIPVLSIW